MTKRSPECHVFLLLLMPSQSDKHLHEPLVVLVASSSSGSSYLVCKSTLEKLLLAFFATYKLSCASSVFIHKDRKPLVMQSMENRKCFLFNFGTTDEPAFKIGGIHPPRKAIVISFCCVWICASGFSSKASWMRGLANWIFLCEYLGGVFL